MPVSIPSLGRRAVGNIIDPEDIAKLHDTMLQLDGSMTGAEATEIVAGVARVDPGVAGDPGTELGFNASNAPVLIRAPISVQSYANVDPTGTVDSTTGIAAAWTKAIAENRRVKFAMGTYQYNGAGLAGNVLPMIEGDGEASTVINLGATSYLYAPSVGLQSLEMRGIRTVGGYGVINHTHTGNNVARRYLVHDCAFFDYTKAAISTNADDMPYWDVQGCIFDGLDMGTTMGLALSGLSDMSIIARNAFLLNRVSLKLARGGSNARIEDNDFIRFTSTRISSNPAIDIWLVPGATDGAGGYGTLMPGNKFGNENLVTGDRRIVVADEGSGATFGERFPVLNAASTGYLTGIEIDSSVVGWNGSAGPIPFLYSTTPNLNANDLGKITAAGISDPSLPLVSIYDAANIVAAKSRQTNTIGPILGTGIGTENMLPPIACDVPGMFKVIDPHGTLHQHPGQPRSGPGSPADYEQLLVNLVAAFSNDGATSISGTTDALGGSDAALMNIPASPSWASFLSGLATYTVGVPIHVEFDVADGGTGTDLASVKINFVGGSGNLFDRVVAVPATGWHTYRFTFTPSFANWLQVHFQNPTGVSGSVKIGRVRVYHATEPVLGGMRLPDYTVTNLTTDRSYDANTVTTAELADIVGTLIADLKAKGL